MRQYIVHMKGTKSRKTEDLAVRVLARSKTQAFGMAYNWFEEGRTDVVYGHDNDKHTIERYIPNIQEYKDHAGKYKVHFSKLKCM